MVYGKCAWGRLKTLAHAKGKPTINTKCLTDLTSAHRQVRVRGLYEHGERDGRVDQPTQPSPGWADARRRVCICRRRTARRWSRRAHTSEVREQTARFCVQRRERLADACAAGRRRRAGAGGGRGRRRHVAVWAICKTGAWRGYAGRVVVPGWWEGRQGRRQTAATATRCCARARQARKRRHRPRAQPRTEA